MVLFGFIHKFRVYKVLAILGLLIVMLVLPHYTGIWDNPMAIPLLILFWLAVAYVVLPEFFRNYGVAILSVYGLVIVLNFYLFYMTSDLPEDHRLTLTNFMVIPIPVFAALWGYGQWRWLKTLKADKAKAELTLLKSQINPHFFFNTLNNLYGLAVEKSDQAPSMILKLSEIMQYTIYDGKADYVPLLNEVAYMEDYIELHKIRYQKKVDIQFKHEIDKTVQVAPLLFIVLLENAFKHGVEPLTENAYIHLSLKTGDNRILFTIENNYDPNTSQQKEGIGLDNLKKRLAHIYPNRHELKTEKTDSVYQVQLNIMSKQ